MSTVHVEAPPPGERHGDELHGSDTIAALHEGLKALREPKRLSVRDVEFTKAGRWIVLRLKWKDGSVLHDVTVRMPKARAKSVSARLRKALA